MNRPWWHRLIPPFLRPSTPPAPGDCVAQSFYVVGEFERRRNDPSWGSAFDRPPTDNLPAVLDQVVEPGNAGGRFLT